MNINFNEKQLHYLKRYAALQFAGSRDNYSTKSPIHFLQKADGYVPVDISEIYDEEDILAIEHNEYPNESYETLDSMVAEALGIDSLKREDIDRYNDSLDEDEPPFLTYEEAYNKYVPNSEIKVRFPMDYLNVYGIDCNEYSFFTHSDTYETVAVSFTHKGLNEIRSESERYVYSRNKYRTYAFTTQDNDFPVLMGVLMEAGEAALAEETGNTCVHMKKHMDRDEIFKELEKHPNEAFDAIDCSVSCEGSLNCNYEIKINIVGTAMVLSSGTKTINATRFVSMKKDGEDEKKFRYPFEFDPYFEEMADAKNVIKVMNYGRYI